MKVIALMIFAITFLSCKNRKEIFADQNFTNALFDEGVDENNNGTFEIEEYLKVTKLRLTNRRISSISGIENFKNLEELSINENFIQNFTALDSLHKLHTLAITLNPTKNKIDFSKIDNLEVLYAVRLNLNEIKLNDKIKSLSIGDNNFVDFDASKYINLETLSLDGCKQLKKVDISNNSKLTQLYLYQTAISELDISNNNLLKIMYVEPNVRLIKNSVQKNRLPSQKITQE